MRIFLLLLGLLVTDRVYAIDEVSVPTPHKTEVFPIAAYEHFLAKVREDCVTGKMPQYVDGLLPPEAPSMEASIVFRPDSFTSRVFVSRSYEDYAGQCAKRGLPTRLIVACGRLRQHPDPMASCPGHSDDYFTVNTSANMQPDILGDVFHMPGQAFLPESWDFIEFEGLSAFFDLYSEEFLGTLVRSLRPGGAWILNFDLSHFPSVIRIGSQTFKGGMTLAEIPTDGPKPLSAMRMICIESGRMINLPLVESLKHST